MRCDVLIADRIPHARLDGVARYMTQLALQFAACPGAPDVRLLCRGRALSPAAWLARCRPPRPGRGLLDRLDARLLRPAAQRLSRCGLIHYPYHNLPANWQVGRQKLVVTVHGAAAVEEPAWGVPEGRADTIRRRLAAAGDRLIHVITVSAWSAQEIVRQFDLDPGQITPIHHGLNPDLFHPQPGSAPLPVDNPYILHVGPCSPRKNVETLVDAFAQLRQRRCLPHRLILAGRDDANRRKVLERCARLGVADAVIAPGVVDDARLADLYRGAACFVFPSLYEGFGMPVLEAMACGAPVIASAVTALPEVAGDAAHLLADPQDAEELADALWRMLEDSAWRQQFIRRGLARARQFTWQAAAQKHLELYRGLL
jgi:glycosyltransferase involved in cell wall biosynthesis